MKFITGRPSSATKIAPIFSTKIAPRVVVRFDGVVVRVVIVTDNCFEALFAANRIVASVR